MLEMARTSWKYKIIQAKTLAEAAKLLKKEEAQVVLPDIDLPDGPGLDFLKEIKKDHEYFTRSNAVSSEKG